MARGWHNESMRHSLAARGIRTRTSITRETVLNDKYQLTFEPISDDPDHIIIKETDDGTKIFYISYDEHRDVDDLIGDAMGELIRADDYGNRYKIEDALEENPYAMVVSAYIHGGEVWFLPEDRQPWHDHWDTAVNAGVWCPDKYLMEHLESFPVSERKVEAKKAAKAFLKMYNAIANGEVYLLAMDEYEPGERIPYNYELVGGYVGIEWAEEDLKEAAKGGHIF